MLIALAKNLGGSVQEALGFENMEAVVKQSARAVFETKKGRLADGPVPEAGKYGSASFESFDKFWEGLVREGAWYHLENTGGGPGKVDLYPAALRLEPEKIDLGFSYYAGGDGSAPDGAAVPDAAAGRISCPIRLS